STTRAVRAAAPSSRRDSRVSRLAAELAFRRRQRQAEHDAALQPGRGAVAGIAVELEQPLQNEQHAMRADPVAPLDGTEGIAEAELGALVDVAGLADTALGDVAADVDEGRHGALRDEARAVVDHDGRLAVVTEQAVRLI